MDVKPNYCKLSSAFSDGTIFRVPKYQRAYSWRKDNVRQFCEDMNELYQAHISGESAEHFLGGIVCVKVEADNGLDERNIYQLVDGQQRLSTTILYFSRLIQKMRLLNLNDEDGELRTRRASDYENKFINLAVEENNEIIKIPRISLSKRDLNFYSDLISKPSEDIPEKYKSHKLLNEAKKIIDKYLDRIVVENGSESLENLKVLYQVVSVCCKILMIKMTDVKDAYRLFQVINDRGRVLTPSDLLRASSLGDLESAENISIAKMDLLIEAWDDITGYDKTDERLIEYYASREAKKTRRVSLFEDFNKSFFSDSAKTEENIIMIRDGITSLDNISNGVWPYVDSNTTLYQQNKLSNLVVKLKHKQAVPLLFVASSKLPESKFYEMLFYIEKFFILYKVALDKRFDSVSRIYLKEIDLINSNPDIYQVKNFLNKLKVILEDRVTQSEINSYLNTLQYSDGEDNRVIKFILLAVEESFEWLSNGSKQGSLGMYKQHEKNISPEMNRYTLEHIYSNNGHKDKDLESNKHDLANLSLLFDQENVDVDNKNFSDKKPYYKKSRIKISNELADYDNWDVFSFRERKSLMHARITRILSLSANIKQ